MIARLTGSLLTYRIGSSCTRPRNDSVHRRPSQNTSSGTIPSKMAGVLYKINTLSELKYNMNTRIDSKPQLMPMMPIGAWSAVV